MKTIILIGARGKMGQAALMGLGNHNVITAGRSGDVDHIVDITDPQSIEALYKKVGHFDAVVNTVGLCEYNTFADMTEDQWMTTVMSKMMGQINLVRIGQKYIADGGSFTLISGILNVKPIPLRLLMLPLAAQLIPSLRLSLMKCQETHVSMSLTRPFLLKRGMFTVK